MSKHLEKIMTSQGFRVQRESPDQFLVRYAGRGTFIDVWNGRRGMTIGIYNPKTRAVQFHRGISKAQVQKLVQAIPEPVNIHEEILKKLHLNHHE